RTAHPPSHADRTGTRPALPGSSRRPAPRSAGAGGYGRPRANASSVLQPRFHGPLRPTTPYPVQENRHNDVRGGVVPDAKEAIICLDQGPFLLPRAWCHRFLDQTFYLLGQLL